MIPSGLSRVVVEGLIRLLTAIALNDSVVVILFPDVPLDLPKKGLVGDSIHISMPYWTDIQLIVEYVRITGAQREYTYHYDRFRVGKIGPSIQLGLAQEAVPSSIESANMLSAGVAGRVASWIRFER